MTAVFKWLTIARGQLLLVEFFLTIQSRSQDHLTGLPVSLIILWDHERRNQQF